MWFKKKEEKEKKKEYFSEVWIKEWRDAIDSSDDYKKKGKNWNAPILLKFIPVPELLKQKGTNGFFLNLNYGECTEMRFAQKSDPAKCDVILTADEKTWLRLIEEKKDPTMMIRKGELKLEKGSLVLLSIQRKAAKALLDTAPVYEDQSADIKTIKPQRPVSVPKRHKYLETRRKSINFDSFPMQLFQKAKKFGIWNPADIDFSKDREQWKGLSEDERNILIHLSSLFMAGKVAIPFDLLPLIQTISKEGRIEEEIFFTSFLWEEAKHTELIARFVSEVMNGRADLEKLHGTFFRELFYRKLPSDLNRLWTDTSPLAQLKAAGTYNIIVKGTLAETSYEGYYKILAEKKLLPGLREGIIKRKQDESRHIEFGLYLISRILEENPEERISFENHLEDLLNDVTNIIHEIFEPYNEVPFGLEKEWFLDYAIRQYQNRIYKLGL